MPMKTLWQKLQSADADCEPNLAPKLLFIMYTKKKKVKIVVNTGQFGESLKKYDNLVTPGSSFHWTTSKR